MPYALVPSRSVKTPGYYVRNTVTGQRFSRRPIPYLNAVKQRAVLNMREHGVPPRAMRAAAPAAAAPAATRRPQRRRSPAPRRVRFAPGRRLATTRVIPARAPKRSLRRSPRRRR
jgi:hypothetical protein